MPQLIQLRRHIRSVQTTKKITYAMRLISMSLYSKLEKETQYLAHHESLLEQLHKKVYYVASDQGYRKHDEREKEDPQTLCILVSSTKGLCGGFNISLFRHFQAEHSPKRHETTTFATVGKKASQFLMDELITKPAEQFDDFSSHTLLVAAEKLTQHILTKNYDSVILYATEFKSFFLGKPRTVQLFPLIPAQADRDPHPEILDPAPIWEQDLGSIMPVLERMHLKGRIANLLFNSLLSEQASRFLAMDNATSNANKLIDKLTLEYNKSRQAMITKELTELTASFASL